MIDITKFFFGFVIIFFCRTYFVIGFDIFVIDVTTTIFVIVINICRLIIFVVIVINIFVNLIISIIIFVVIVIILYLLMGIRRITR